MKNKVYLKKKVFYFFANSFLYIQDEIKEITKQIPVSEK